MKTLQISKILFSILSIICILLNCNIASALYSSNYAEPTVLIRKGAYGNGVRWVQEMLNNNGYDLSVDGSFGPKTLNAVLHFQSLRGLAVDGIVGTATRNALKNGNTLQKEINDYRYTTANLNFRSGPNTTYSSKCIIPRNASLYVIYKRSDGWVYAKYNETYGYVYANYLTDEGPRTSTLPTFSRTSLSLLNIIKNCKNYYANNNFYYSTASGVRTIPADKSKIYNGVYFVDCSSYVTWALYEYALINGNTSMEKYFSTQKSSGAFASIGASGGNNYLKVVDKKDSTGNVDLANAKAGDILVTPGHVEFFSSYIKTGTDKVNIKVYNCGSNDSIKVAGVTNSGTTNVSEIRYILRVR